MENIDLTNSRANVYEPKDKELYIFGHRHPDTDSICTTLAYAILKRKMGWEKVIPARLGELNKETTYVLNRFKFEAPKLVESLKPQVKDLKFYESGAIDSRVDIKTARIRMHDGGVKRRILPVSSSTKGKLLGVVSNSNIIKCIEDFYASESIGSEIILSNLLRNLDATEIIGDNIPEKVNGKVLIDSQASKETINDGDILVATDEHAAEVILENNSGFIVIVPKIKNASFIDKYKNKNVVIIKTDMGLLNTLYNIAQSISVYSVMTDDNIEYFEEDEFIEDIRDTVADSKYTHFPIVDDEGVVKGVLSRRHLLSFQKKNVVLIDHNEPAQSIIGLKEANILEIVDHHKIEGISTNYPPMLRVEPVGCSATVVWKLFHENNIEIEKEEAILLLSSILSDTLILHSPTCTPADVVAAKELEKISGLSIEKYGKEMISSALDIKDEEWQEVIKSDIKRFKVSDFDIEISNLNISDYKDLLDKKDFIRDKMFKAMLDDGCDAFILMLTDITNNGAWIITAGGDSKLYHHAFGMASGCDNIFMPGVLSRKKQVLPKLLQAIDILKKS